MGGVRTRNVKRAAREIVEKYYHILTFDFVMNKKICEHVASIQTKKHRNKIAGFVTHLVHKISRGAASGISLKLQEREREKRMDHIPEQSEFDVSSIFVDTDTYDMIKNMGIRIPSLTTEENQATLATSRLGNRPITRLH